MFDKIKTPQLKFKTSELPSYPRNNYTLPALTAGIQNQGLNNYIPRKGATILKNVISISANGANTGATFYQNKDFAVLQDAYAIKWKNKDIIISDNQYLFLTSCIRKSILGKFEWTNKAGWERIKSEIIKLPQKDGKIDFEFMESFVSELEAQRVAKLEAYLSATGLSDYNLTPEESMALHNFENMTDIEWDTYKLENLFDINPSKYYRLSNEEILKTNGTVPLVSNQSVDNGVMGYSNLEPLNSGNSISCSDTTVGADTMFYQKNNFIGYSHIQHLVSKTKIFNFEVATFIISSCKVATSNQSYDYGHKFNRDNMNRTTIYLPTKNGEIDYEFIQNFISAIQKLVIKDVVLYADRNINATKQIINNK